MGYMTDERRMIQETARAFVMKEVLPVANRLDPEKGDIPPELIQKLADMGYFGIVIPEQYGGLGLGVFEYCLITEELARGWMSVASIIARGNGLSAGRGMTDAQRAVFLPRAARGEFLGAAAMSEPNVGSDLGSIACRARRDGDDWVITGNKYWCTFADGADHPLLRSIPDVLHITAADRASRPMLDDVLRLLVRRMFEAEPGAAATVSRLSEVLFIEAMRAGIAQAQDIGRLMSAVYDPQIGRALMLIHGDVAAPWTVESLAAAVGMSRSRFAERFSQLVDSGPMAYIAEWRLQRALSALAAEATPIKTIAFSVGYRSAAAFTRAFTERFGCSPKERRRAG